MEKTEALFRRCTGEVLALDIFKIYIQYVKANNSTVEGRPRGPTERLVIMQAFEYTLSLVGVDKESGPLWLEYISNLKNVEVSKSPNRLHHFCCPRMTHHVTAEGSDPDFIKHARPVLTL